MQAHKEVPKFLAQHAEDKQRNMMNDVQIMHHMIHKKITENECACKLFSAQIEKQLSHMHRRFDVVDKRFNQINKVLFKLSNQMTKMKSFIMMQSNNHKMNERALIFCSAGGNIGQRNICRMNDDALVSSAVD